MENNHNSASDEERRHYVLELLTRYPALESTELADLVHWLRKEASALDVGLIASDPKLKAPYESLREDHLSRLNGADLFWMFMLVGAGFIAIGLLIWSSM